MEMESVFLDNLPDTANMILNIRKYVIIRICQQLYFSDTLFS